MELKISYPDVELDLFSGGLAANEYFPDSPASGNAFDRFEVQVTSTSPDAVGTLVRSIEHALDYARRFQQDPYKRVWLLFAPADSGTTWRSQIVGGTVAVSQRMARMIKGNTTRVTVVLERLPFWEGPVTQILMTDWATNQPTSAYMDVFNCNDEVVVGSFKARRNYIQFASSQITGSLPAPVKLEIVRDYGSSPHSADEKPTGMIWVGLKENDTNGNPYFLPSDSSTVSGTQQADSNSSNSHRLAVAITGSDPVTIGTWQLDGEDFISTIGDNFNAILRLANVASVSGIRFRVRAGNSPNATYGPWTTLTDISGGALRYVHSLGAVKVRSWQQDRTHPPKYIYINLEAQLVAGGSATIYLDYLQLMPIGYGRFYRCPTNSAGASGALDPAVLAKLIDDPSERVLCSIYPAFNGGGTDGWVVVGEPIMVEPNAGIAHIYFAFAATVKSSESATPVWARHQVKAWYRPRRKTL